jgi:hypothetical protein
MADHYTPGPWRVGGHGGIYDSVVSDVPPNPRRTAEELQEEVGYYGGYLIAESITRANGVLIATAPELLAAARLVANAYGRSAAELADAMCVLRGTIARVESAND